MARRTARICLVLLANFLLMAAMNISSHAAATSVKPVFQMPFACGQVWYGQTRAGHQPSALALDLNLPADADAGLPVLAGVYGMAKVLSDPDGYGNYVDVAVAGPGNWHVIYAHLSPTGLVGNGQVTPQTQIGRVASTGHSTGNHLHYEQRQGATLQAIEFNGVGVSYATSSTGYAITSANCVGSGVGTANFDGRDFLKSGGAESTLLPGHYLMSGDGRFVLILQPDGNLVLYGPGYQVLWQTGTHTAPGRLILQPDGNLVLQDPAGNPYWDTGSSGGASHLTVQPDGQLAVYSDPYGAVQWTNGTLLGSVVVAEGDDRLTQGQWLTPDTYLRSANLRYVCVLQSDGNIVVYEPGWRVAWQAYKLGNAPKHLLMQPDGNLVAYPVSGPPYWNPGTSGGAGSYALMQDDGNFVVYNSAGTAQWAAR